MTCIDPLSSLSMRPLLVRGRGCIPFLVFLFPSSGRSTPAVSCAVSPGRSYHPFVRSALLVCCVAPLLCAMCAIDFARPFHASAVGQKGLVRDMHRPAVFPEHAATPGSRAWLHSISRVSRPFFRFLNACRFVCGPTWLVISPVCPVGASGPSRCTLVVCDERD